jgi:hypothetical protein
MEKLNMIMKKNKEDEKKNRSMKRQTIVVGRK